VRAADSIARLQASLNTPAMNLYLMTSTLDGTYEHELSDRIRGSAGFTSMWQYNEQSGKVNLIPDYRLWGLGAYLFESMTYNDLTLSGGVRYDVRDLKSAVVIRPNNNVELQTRRWENLTGSLGAMWQISDKITANMNLATAWRPPQVNELYSNDVHHGSAYYEVGDSTLLNERTLGGDASISYNETGIEVEVSGFFHAIDNYIMAVPDAANPTVTVRGTFPTFRFTQMNAQLAGGDINATIALGRQISVYGSTALVRGINVDRDEPLLFVPADRARIGLHLHAEDVWELHDSYVDLSLSGVRRQDRVVSGRDYAEPPAGYFRTDLSIGGILTFSDNVLGRLTLTCNNLFNVAYRDYLSQYRYFTDDPGRNIILRFTTSF